MTGFRLTLWLFVCMLCLIKSQLSEALEDPDLLAFGNSGSTYNTKNKNVGSLDDCKHQLAICQKIVQSHDTQNEVLEQMKQVVGSWMFRVGMDKHQLPPGDKKSVSLIFTLSDIDLKTINSFLKENSYYNFVSVVPVLNKIFTLNVAGSYSEFIGQKSETIIQKKEKWVQIIFDIIISCMNKETLLVLVCLIMGFVLLKALIFGASPTFLVNMFILFVFFSGFLWNWAFLYQQAAVDQHVKQMKYEKYASNCKVDNSFWGAVKAFFGYHASLDECTEYFRAKKIDPLIMVSPTLALSETLAMFITHPTVRLAESMHKITKILFGNLPWGMYYGTVIVSLVFSYIFIATFILLTGRSFKLKCYLLGTIEVGSWWQSDNRNVQGLDRDYIEYRPHHREAVQDKETTATNRIDQTGNNFQENQAESNIHTNETQNKCKTNQTIKHNSCCNATSYIVSCAHPVSQCGESHYHPLPDLRTSQGHHSTTSCSGSFGENLNPISSRQNTNILLRNSTVQNTSGSSLRNRHCPSRDVTERFTDYFANDNKVELEEFIYTRRRKLSM